MQLGVKVPFLEARKIDIVVTSLAQAGSPHGLLNEFLRLYRVNSHRLPKAGHVGDIQLPPFSEEGPLPVAGGKRPLRPLLARPALRAFDRLISDSRTIWELLEDGKNGSGD